MIVSQFVLPTEIDLRNQLPLINCLNVKIPTWTSNYISSLAWATVQSSPQSPLSFWSAPSAFLVLTKRKAGSGDELKIVVWLGKGGSEPPAFCTFNSRFPPLSVVVPSSLSHFDCKILGNVTIFFLNFSRSLHDPPPWDSRFPPPPLPPPAPFRPGSSLTTAVACAIILFPGLDCDTTIWRPLLRRYREKNLSSGTRFGEVSFGL